MHVLDPQKVTLPGQLQFSIGPSPREILRITADGKMKRGDVDIEDASREELLNIIRDFVELAKTR